VAVSDPQRDNGTAPEPEALIPEARDVQRRRLRKRWAATALVAVLLAGGGFILFGGSSSPAAPTHIRLPHGIAAKASDPAGGSAWGTRIVRGDGWTCVQLARLKGDRLGIIGEDDLYHDDGQFHVVPASQTRRSVCAATDGAGHAFMALELGAVAKAGRGGNGQIGCTSGNTQGPVCPSRDMRFIQYGLLGPEARSITYTDNGHTEATATGPDGAYLLVGMATLAACKTFKNYGLCGQSGNGSSSTLSGALGGTITSVTYSNGRTCQVTARPSAGRPADCGEVGYVKPKPEVAASQVAAPVTYHAIPASAYCLSNSSDTQSYIGWPAAQKTDLGVYLPCTPALRAADNANAGPPQYGLLVSFSWIARQPATSKTAHYSYSLTGLRCGGGSASTYGRITAGERLTRAMIIPSRCKGTVTGTVTYDPNIGPGPEVPIVGRAEPLYSPPALREGPNAIVVGNFTVHVPARP
jgi:hypothetical protein